jgi:hypothetical protein
VVTDGSEETEGVGRRVEKLVFKGGWVNGEGMATE